MSMINRRHVGMVLAEFLGVAVLTSVLLAVGKSGVGYSYFLSSGVALAFLGSSLLLSRSSGAQFNPAVTLGLWSARQMPTVKAVFYLAAQFAGGAVAWRLFTYLTGQALPSTPATFAWPIIVAEGIAAMVIAMGVAAAIYQKFEGLQFAATVAGALFVGTMVASLGSNGIGNPAVALGVHSWSWTYVAGPLVGGILGINLYLYLFAPQEAYNKAIAKVSRISSRGKTVKKPATRRRKK